MFSKMSEEELINWLGFHPTRLNQYLIFLEKEIKYLENNIRRYKDFNKNCNHLENMLNDSKKELNRAKTYESWLKNKK